jgi:hypothetical protein
MPMSTAYSRDKVDVFRFRVVIRKWNAYFYVNNHRTLCRNANNGWECWARSL